MMRAKNRPDSAGAGTPGTVTGAEAGAAEGRPTGAQPQGIPATIAGRTWFALAAALVLLIAVLIFILQNLKDVKVSFVAWHWTIPLGVDLLFAAALGGLTVLAAGSIRIWQLRRLAKRRAGSPPNGS